MKLATLKDGTRDGRLLVVSRDLTRAATVPHIKTLQAALDDWDAVAPDLLTLSEQLNSGKISGTLAFDAAGRTPRLYAVKGMPTSVLIGTSGAPARCRSAPSPPSPPCSPASSPC